MDRRLFDAAQTRNIDSLHQLLRENALLLDQIALFSSEIPLHIAYTAGKFDFVKEIINLKPDLAKEVNQNGFSFMHMAVVSGHLEIVSELMKVDPSLCRFQQGTHDMKTPFQFASIKGRANEINEMLSGCAECIEDVTLQKETALQLAVKCCQFEAVSVLVHWIGFSTSLYMIKILTSKFPLEFELGMCILAMFFSYNTALTYISADDVTVVVIIITAILSSITPLLSKWIQRLIGWIIKFTVENIHNII
ncbi:ankyrin repeat-containing protein At2g01680-like [Durio zibethinus]|uniref:Ankyrin repeat-containing protein At2g01680-like n=1 Tax=Durio zibethinus TaxID=66656 RepID=A0A6P6B2N1_DURZI|nr:ankyrin repeat-containing protein At2g01680-like [Durio zibethinus]